MRELDCGTFAHRLIAPIFVLAGAPRETVDYPIEGRPPLVIDDSWGSWTTAFGWCRGRVTSRTRGSTRRARSLRRETQEGMTAMSGIG
jgi:hypothetical protein